MKLRYSLFLLFSSALSAGALQDFSHYEVILEKQVFGKPPPEPVVTTAPTPPPGPSWVTEYRMAMLVDEGNGSIRAGLVHIRDNTMVSLSLKETDKATGIQFVSADPAQESAVFTRSGDQQTIRMTAATVPIATTAPAFNNNPRAGGNFRGSGGTRGSGRYDSGRFRQQPNTPPVPQAPAQPRLSGEELEAHLQEYQKEVLRKGMPPLPVALTPETDAQLVEEGVLPQLEAPQHNGGGRGSQHGAE